MKSYILIGPPGSGKSTLAKCIAEKLELEHVDVGAELRRAASENTPFAEEINDTINHKKELVPDMVVYGVLAQALMRVPDTVGVVLDGAPRPVSQIDEVLHILSVSGRAVERVIYINLPEEESVARIARRYRCAQCGLPLILGQDFHDPLSACPKCGGTPEQRPDDTPEGVRKRYRIFQIMTLPVVEHFRKKKLLLQIDGTTTPERLCQEVVDELRSTPSL